MYRDYKIVAPIAFVVLLIVGLIFLIPAMAEDGKRYQEWCESQGGRVDTNTQVSTAMGVDPTTGRMVPTTVTTSTTYCVAKTGIIDVR